jgi:RNA polymerase sigma factor (sigma-70 family)
MDEQHPNQETFELIRRYRAGDPHALGILLQRYHPTLERIVRVRMGPALLAFTSVADVIQDTIVRVIKDIDSYQPRDDASWIDWVAKLAQHEIHNQVRARQARKRGGGAAAAVGQIENPEPDVPDTATGASSVAARNELMDIVDRHAGELPTDQREVFVLRHYAGADWNAIAERMLRSVAACQELARRARLALAERMSRSPGQ